MTSSKPDLTTLQQWLHSVLGETPPDWEVTPKTVDILTSLYLTNVRLEHSALVEMEALEQTKAEYEAEIERQKKLLSLLSGLEEEMNRGPAQGYLSTLADLCSELGLDTGSGGRLETHIGRLLVTQAELGPRLAKAKVELERGEKETVELYSRLARLGEVCEEAGKVSRAGDQVAKEQIKKTQFTLAKVEQYKRDVERGEMVLARNGGTDLNLRHKEVRALKERLVSVQAAAEPLRRELAGFLNLPPSLELGRVEVSACREELERLEQEVQKKISTLHI